jgi:histidine triad (HIT) family protein
MSNECLFCKIAAGAIPSKKIYEDDELFAFHDINPQSPVHFLVIPKKHIPNIMDADDSALLGRLCLRAATLAKELGLEERGARFVINCKEDGAQTVPHLHMHILGGRQLGWPPG